MSRKPPEIKVFDKWSTDGIEITDPGLGNYLSVTPILYPIAGVGTSTSAFARLH